MSDLATSDGTDLPRCAASMVIMDRPYSAFHDPVLDIVDQAAAPHASLSSLLWSAAIFVFPLTLVDMNVIYWLFKEKNVEEEGYD